MSVVAPNEKDEPIGSIPKFTTKNQLKNGAGDAPRDDAGLEGDHLKRDAVYTRKIDAPRKERKESVINEPTAIKEVSIQVNTANKVHQTLDDHEFRAGRASSATLVTVSSTAGDLNPKASSKADPHNNRAIYDNESTGNQYANQHRGQSIGRESDNAVINGPTDNGFKEEDFNVQADRLEKALERGPDLPTKPNHLEDQSYAKELNELTELKELSKALQTVSRSKSDVGHRLARTATASRFKQSDMQRVFNTIGLDMARSQQSADSPAYQNLSSSFERNPFLNPRLAFGNELENGFGTRFDAGFATEFGADFRAGFGSSFSNTNLYTANQSFYPTIYTAPYSTVYPSQLSRELSNGLLHYYSSGSQLYCNLSTVDSSYYTIDSSPKQALSSGGNLTERDGNRLDKIERLDRTERPDLIERLDKVEQERRPADGRSDANRIDKSLKNEKQSPVYFKANQVENAGQTNQLINLTKSFNSMQLNEFKTAQSNQLTASNSPNLLVSASMHSPLLDAATNTANLHSNMHSATSNLHSAVNLHSTANLTTNLIANLDPTLATSFNSVGLPSRPPPPLNGLHAGTMPAAKISQQLIKPNGFKANLGLASKPILADHHDLDGEISIIERNARVIKWLYNCKKYYESAA